MYPNKIMKKRKPQQQKNFDQKIRDKIIKCH